MNKNTIKVGDVIRPKKGVVISRLDAWDEPRMHLADSSAAHDFIVMAKYDEDGTIFLKCKCTTSDMDFYYSTFTPDRVKYVIAVSEKDVISITAQKKELKEIEELRKESNRLSKKANALWKEANDKSTDLYDEDTSEEIINNLLKWWL